MKLEDLEAKLGIANMGEEDKLALVKDIQANLPALKAEQRSLEAKTQANLVVEAIKKIKEGLEARFDELNGIVDVKVRDITSGKDGIDGKDGKNGKDGRDGKDGISITGPKGADGEAGQDGVGVQDAHIDFDGSLIITLTDGRELNVGEVVPMDVAEKIKIIGNGGGTSQSVLDSLTSLQNQINTLTGIDGTLGTMAQQDDTAVDINGGNIDGTVIGNTTPAAGTFTTLTATGQTSLGGAAGSESLRVATPATVGSFLQVQGASTGVVLRATGDTGTNSSLTSVTRGTLGHIFSTGGTVGNSQLQISHTASAVNYVQVTGAATGGNPVISAQGSDSSISVNLTSKSAGDVRLITGGASGWVRLFPNGTEVVRATAATSGVNYVNFTGAAAGSAPSMASAGSDTNISQVFQSKGTGAIDLAAGSSGVNISNGGTVTALTTTSVAGTYTSIPTVAITTPTTAGGVQATANATMRVTGSASATIVSGGTGYTAGDVLSVVGGTGGPTQITVGTVSAGVIQTVTVTSNPQYTALPTNPVSVTGGTGSSATFNLVYYVNGFTITNAGSGYVEQPTVSFSGGGGSGAAAYATVGSGTVVKSIGATLDIFVDSTSSQAFRFYNSGGTGVNYWSAGAGSSSPFLFARGSTNTQGNIASNGTSSLAFFTNGGATQQFNVSHTASAVNYVQVTGAATGNQPVISTQGSDTNVILNIASKGNAGILFNANSAEQFRTGAVASSVNSLQLNGATTGNSPSLQARGSNTDIDVVFTPKGTGNVRFGTYTGTILTPTGYIEIKDSGGTTRRLLVG